MARGQVKRMPVFVGEDGPAQGKVPMKDQTNEVVLAMDIGTRSIIGMVGVVEEGKVNVIAVEKEEHTERAMIDGQIENIDKVSALAGKVKKRLESKTHIRLERVCVAAAGRALRTKRADFELELPGTQLIDDEVISRLEAGAITRAEEAFDAENEASEDVRRYYLVGYTVCQYFLDQYMISNLKDHRGRHLKVDLIATFLPSEVVESLYTTMNKIGLEVASLTLEPIAAINAAIPENLRLLNLVLVDIGAGTSDIAACTGGSITGYTMATVAGDEITETIMKQYLVDFPTAESMKAQLEDKEEIRFGNILGFEQKLSRADVLQSIRGAQEALSKEIADKVVEINGTAPSALFLAGGGSKLAGMKESITEALGMDGNRVAIAGNYFQVSAFSTEYDLNDPEYATPLGIAVSSGLNLINDSFRVILNDRPAKLFRSGTFTALNLLMMNGFNFRDIMGRAGANLAVTVNGRRKVFYGTSSEPASLFINQKEGRLSDVIHAGDIIEFIPAVHGVAAKACLGDVEGAATGEDVTLNGMRASLKTPLKNGDVITVRQPAVKAEEKPREEEAVFERGEALLQTEAKLPSAGEGLPSTEAKLPSTEEELPSTEEELFSTKEKLLSTGEGLLSTEEKLPSTGEELHSTEEKLFLTKGTLHSTEEKLPSTKEKLLPTQEGSLSQAEEESDETSLPDVSEAVEQGGASGLERLGRFGVKVAPVRGAKTEGEDPEAKEEDEAAALEMPEEEPPAAEKTVFFHFNGAPFRLPKKEDGRPYYLMDLIQYSGIDLEHPRGNVLLSVNGEEGRFQQVLREGDVIQITEEERRS